MRRLVADIRSQLPPETTCRLDFEPGDAAQVDFGAGPVLTHPDGLPRRTWAFVMTLANSRHQYVEFVWDQTVATWLGCHRRAFEWFAGVPRRVIIDNAKCAITRACAQDPTVQRAYAEAAEGYRFKIDPCPPHDPQKKGIVESGVKYLKGNFLPLRTFRDLADLNAQARAWVMDEAGVRCHGTTRRSPLALFALGMMQVGLVLALEPAQNERLADEDYLDDVAAAFARVIDAKSPFTSGHSDRVALFSDMIAEEMGCTLARRRKIKRAALLHDIGKLGVSNSVLDKNGKLDDEEWISMKQHAAYSEAILEKITAFAELAKIAGAHHERLDGKGYPNGLSGDQIGMDTRIISTADVFDALTADRPYRAAMPVSKAFSILDEDAGRSHDPLCIEALKRAIARADLLKAA